MSRFKGNYFHFLSRKGKGRKTSKLLGLRGGRQVGIWAPLLPLQSLCRCPEVTASASLSSARPRTNGFHSLSRAEGACHCSQSLDSPLTSAFPAHYNTTSLEAPIPHLQARGQPPGSHKPEREVTLDLQEGAGSSVLGLTLRPCLLSGAPHTIGKSEKLKTKIIELPTPDVSLL